MRKRVVWAVFGVAVCAVLILLTQRLRRLGIGGHRGQPLSLKKVL
ncbi:MAG: hypothetical protein BWX70_01195 [Verrucomicrobia bacterium ADurb.Bin070]|jgi:hypothetical protein|nr:MAG: hypothetical protein BWX70_01195 [Verrucomicrobia bacterium ADurb.Bin070]